MNPVNAFEDSAEVAVDPADLQEGIRIELEQAGLELKEVSMMLEQSKLEVSRLAQRNASATAHLGQVHDQYESIPRGDILSAYEAALEAQQRLFLMRGQLEKLQSSQAYLERHITSMEKLIQLVNQYQPRTASAPGPSATVQTLEMLIQAQETERQKLSQQMHDGPAQALSNFILQTEIAMRLFDMDKEKAREELDALKTTATGTFQKVRDFIFELRPMMLDDLGLIPTIKRYTAAFKEQSGLEVSLVTTGVERRLESYLEVMIFRAVQELLGNAVVQSLASQVKAQIDMAEASVRVAVEDNGRGLNQESFDKEGGKGVHLIKERVEMLGGSFTIDSILGQGTRFFFQIPAAPLEGK